MIWNVLLVISLIATVVFTARSIFDLRERKGARSNTNWKAKQGLAVLTWCVAAILMLVSLICLGTNSNDVSTYKRSGELVTLKQQQRDALAIIIKEELSTEQYAAIMAATPQTDVLIILGNNAATFLVEKTKLLVSLNAEVNRLVNNLAQDRISLCAYADNPISPRLFVGPECPAPIVAVSP